MTKSRLTYQLISQIGVKEKYVRNEHYNSIKVWWARRPLTAMRSLLVKEILQRNSLIDEEIDTSLFSDINPTKDSIEKFATKYQTNNLSVLDVFAGGGSIPFESARLGCMTYAGELNPVASLLQETIFNSVRIENFSEKLKEAAYNIIERAEKRIGRYFQFKDINPYVTFWSKVMSCKKCGAEVDLRRLVFLSKRKGKELFIAKSNGKLNLCSRIEEQIEDYSDKEFTCTKCNTSHSFGDIKLYCESNEFKYNPFAICYTDNTAGKKFKIVSDNEKEIFKKYNELIEKEIQTLSRYIPNEPVKSKGGVINPTLYDLKYPRDFFNLRQLLSLLTIIDEISIEYETILNLYGNTDAKQIVLGLTSLIEFLVDWNSVSTMWISQNTQTGRSLAGPGVGMKWDFIEINPFSQGGSNLRSKIDRVCKSFNALQLNNKIQIINGSSTSLPLEDELIDIILTDPPYYDSIDYTGLSEFFRPWFETLIRNTYDPKINLRNHDQFEAIVELNKHSKKNHSHYEKIMTGVLSESKRVLRGDGSILMLYSHKTFEGWKVIADSFKSSGLYVTDIIPIEMERIARPRAMSYEALNGVIVFRLKKLGTQISSVSDNLKDLKSQIESQNILDSQIVIYLAGLAVKQVTLTGESYETAYSKIIKDYERIKINEWLNGQMDIISKNYLEAKLSGKLSELDQNFVQSLIGNSLVLDGRLKTLDEIPLENVSENSIIYTALEIYHKFKRNSKTKVHFEDSKKESLITFFSIIGGFTLNTVEKRSSSEEAKVARLVLSKVSLE